MTIPEALKTAFEEVFDGEVVISSLAEAMKLHDDCIQMRTNCMFNFNLDVMPHYRGEQNFGWKILPGMFRPPINLDSADEGKEMEQLAIDEFERVINQEIGDSAFREIVANNDYAKKWDLLFQAQHAGIKTTLTDWSAGITTALFFATEESTSSEIENADGQIWFFMVPVQSILGDVPAVEHSFMNLDPSKISQTFLINPASYIDNISDRIFEYRMFKQRGRFLISPSAICNEAIEEQKDIKPFILRARVSASSKEKIRNELEELGITREAFYVDENPRHDELIQGINNKVYS